MKNVYLNLREYVAKIINYEKKKKKKKKEMIPLTNEEKNYIISKKYVIYAQK